MGRHGPDTPEPLLPVGRWPGSKEYVPTYEFGRMATQEFRFSLRVAHLRTPGPRS
jgi:hypothetical protein